MAPEWRRLVSVETSGCLGEREGMVPGKAFPVVVRILVGNQGFTLGRSQDERTHAFGIFESERLAAR
jgi:hypothetical protein